MHVCIVPGARQHQGIIREGPRADLVLAWPQHRLTRETGCNYAGRNDQNAADPCAGREGHEFIPRASRSVGDVQHRLRQEFLELGFSSLDRLQLASVGRLHPTVAGAPIVLRRVDYRGTAPTHVRLLPVAPPGIQRASAFVFSSLSHFRLLWRLDSGSLINPCVMALATRLAPASTLRWG